MCGSPEGDYVSCRHRGLSDERLTVRRLAIHAAWRCHRRQQVAEPTAKVVVTFSLSIQAGSVPLESLGCRRMRSPRSWRPCTL